MIVVFLYGVIFGVGEVGCVGGGLGCVGRGLGWVGVIIGFIIGWIISIV